MVHPKTLFADINYSWTVFVKIGQILIIFTLYIHFVRHFMLSKNGFGLSTFNTRSLHVRPCTVIGV